MSNFVVILKIFPDFDTRYLIHYAKNKVSIIGQKFGNHQWTPGKHFNLPMSLIDTIQILRVETAILENKGLLLQVEKRLKKSVIDFSILHPTVRKIIYDYEIANVPLYENQQRYWDEIETLKSVWHMKMSPDSPDSSTQNAIFTPTIDSPVDNLDTPRSEDHKSPSLFDTPPVKFCYAPKKRKLERKIDFQNKNFFKILLCLKLRALYWCFSLSCQQNITLVCVSMLCFYSFNSENCNKNSNLVEFWSSSKRRK